MSTIPGFTFRGGRWRTGVALEEADAKAVVAEARRRDVPVATVLRELVRRGLGRKRRALAAAEEEG